ncbi:hypothetical protein RWE15_15460 [Virgibacillus halophilus]|uniref:Uncharacterized protein n=1 Tax=Tigheibacillus halophilus TaxID=361280 RepID=A0ABU5C8L4_9BACI|nr:hypothetical protein [Virgibacillus halophilus]
MESLEHLLTLDILHNARIIAGEEGTSRMVETVETLDTPDMAHFFNGECFIAHHWFLFTERT